MTTVLDSLNSALHSAFARDASVYLLGQDVLDPYGGAFKVTRGLSEAYPDRVITTPVSEAGIVGVATGMALRGLRPVVEIMFGDFLTLTADQLINSAAKFRWMYNDQVRVPIVLRSPAGGRRGYGPTHSQTLEKIFLGVPGLRVLAPAALDSPGALLSRAVLQAEDPVLFVENKVLYLLPVLGIGEQGEFLIEDISASGGETVYRLRVRGAPPPSLTLAAYGYMAELARQAALTLAYEHEIFVELIVPTCLAPMDVTPLIESVGRTGCLLAVEEGSLPLGWGAEVLARLAETPGTPIRRARRLAATETPIPAAPGLEEAALPGANDIVRAARELMA